MQSSLFITHIERHSLLPKGLVVIDRLVRYTLSPSGKKNKYDTLDNFPGEVLTDIRALADQFLIAFPNINTWYDLKIRNNVCGS